MKSALIKLKHVFILLAFVFSLTEAFAQVENFVPNAPNPPRLVNNLSKEFPDFISKQEQLALEEVLVRFNDSTSNQIVVVIIDDLQGYSANEFATAIGHKWGVGQAKFDNGVVMLIKPTSDNGGRDLYIAVGYGLEGAIPDISAKEVINTMIPLLKNGENYSAIETGISMLMAMAKGEYNSDEFAGKKRKESGWVVGLIVLIIVLYMFFGPKKGYYDIGRRGGRYHRGGWFIGGGGGHSSGGGFGGFGGFGGGGFGGGGAGGKW